MIELGRPEPSFSRAGWRNHLFRGPVDARLAPKERVVALLEARPTVVVPFSRLAREPAVAVRAGRVPAVVLYARGVASAIDQDWVIGTKDVGTAGAFGHRLDGRTLLVRAPRSELRRPPDQLTLGRHRPAAAACAPRRTGLVLAHGVSAAGADRRRLVAVARTGGAIIILPS